MKHTKGPWMVVNNFIYAGPFAACKNKFFDTRPLLDGVAKINKIRVADVDFRGDDKEQMKANAHLIAAAPEMLEALENVLRYLERSGEAYLLENFGVNEAIKKAKGV